MTADPARRVVSWLAAFSAIMGIVLGLANNTENSTQAQLHSQQNALNREYMDLAIAQRLVAIQPVDTVWLAAKQAEIDRLQLSVNGLSRTLSSVGVVELLLALGLVLCQIGILEREAMDTTGLRPASRRALDAVPWLGVGCGLVASVWFIWLATVG
jgi:hypothetical protein